MFCPNCGTPVADTANFCSKCGTRISKEPLNKHPLFCPHPNVSSFLHKIKAIIA